MKINSVWLKAVVMLSPLKGQYSITREYFGDIDCHDGGGNIYDTQYDKGDKCKEGCYNDYQMKLSGYTTCTTFAPTSTSTPTVAPTSTSTPAVAPTSTPTSTAPPTSKSNGGGDPHFHMWDGQWFSFHGECDLVLVYSPNFAAGAGLHVHARTTKRREFSFISGLAMSIGNETLEIAGQYEYHLNGRAKTKVPSLFAGFHINQFNKTMPCKNGRCAKVFAFSIDFGKYGKAVITIWNDLLYIALSGTEMGFEGAVGLMGSWGKLGKLARDKRGIMKDSNAFGAEWQVLYSEPMLFHEARAPQHPQPCNPASKATERRLPTDTEANMAQSACSHLSEQAFEMCIVDVMLTGDINMAFIPNFY